MNSPAKELVATFKNAVKDLPEKKPVAIQAGQLSQLVELAEKGPASAPAGPVSKTDPK